MKKINLQGVLDTLSEKEMKKIRGGSGGSGGGSCPEGEFICYCNGYNYGCVCSLPECWGKC
jgi:hypothetical protein